MPAGTHGPILLATHNFDVIKTYNNSNAYVLAVGLLGDAIVGPRGVAHALADKDHALTRAELKIVQTELKTPRLRHRRDRRPRGAEAGAGGARVSVRGRADARRLRQPGAADTAEGAPS